MAKHSEQGEFAVNDAGEIRRGQIMCGPVGPQVLFLLGWTSMERFE